jgi:hypothetical protein
VQDQATELPVAVPNPASDPHPMDDADDTDRPGVDWAWIRAEMAPSISDSAARAAWEQDA